MRAVWLCGLNILLLIGACVATPRAYAASFYTTTVVLAMLALGSVAAILITVSRLVEREVRVETTTPRPSDLDAIRSKALLDHAPVTLLYESSDGIVHAANRAARRLFSTEDHLPAEQALMFETQDRLLRFSPSSGIPPRTYSLSSIQTSGTGGIRQLIALMDIETELNEADARALRELLSVLSHEIMNSLTPVISLAETAHDLAQRLNEAQSQEMLVEALNTIMRRTRGINRFVQGYRTLARLPSPERRPIFLKDLALTLAALFEARWGEQVLLRVNFPPSHSIANLDAEQIEQALLNLLNNAADAALESKNDTRPTVWLETKVISSGTIFFVRDNGPGVAEANREAIFQPFFTLKRDGSGIGLTLARQIALSHGGSLTLAAAQPLAPWKTSFIFTV
ncbi:MULTISPECIES: sensor histidine kinase [Acetobacter]|nr:MULTISPECIES: HAMP domain-containing sensor histidine kinase [Acetobacter]MCG4274365.1 HAMP domain-containing histidine kinase [Acetobacter senegalensis]